MGEFMREEYKKNQFAYLLEKNTKEKLIAELKNISPCVKAVYDGIAFPGGAISIVATPHLNKEAGFFKVLAFNTLEQNRQKNLYFFSYKQTASEMLENFLNTIGCLYVDDAEILYHEREKFVYDLLETESLRLIYTDMKVDQLVKGIRFIKDNDPDVGIIYIDYLQLLRRKDPHFSEQEELTQICLMLKDCAIETGLPIVLAAHFNRYGALEVDNEVSNSIGKTNAIEGIASFIIGAYNQNFCFGKINEKDLLRKVQITVKILKSRNGVSGWVDDVVFYVKD